MEKKIEYLKVLFGAHRAWMTQNMKYSITYNCGVLFGEHCHSLHILLLSFSSRQKGSKRRKLAAQVPVPRVKRYLDFTNPLHSIILDSLFDSDLVLATFLLASFLSPWNMFCLLSVFFFFHFFWVWSWFMKWWYNFKHVLTFSSSLA